MREAEKIRAGLTGVSLTMFATLYAKALDASSSAPILGDTFAKELVDRIEYDWAQTTMNARNAPSVVIRTAHFDNWVRQFLAVHERAIVLHLGCGLDSRVFRLDPGAGVEWYDIDYPEVIALRQRFYPERPHYRALAASVTDPAWLAAITPDRPALLIAEGLTYYLSKEEGLALLRRVVEHFGSGELQFDVFNSLGIRSQKINGVVRRAGATLYWGVDGPADILSAVPGVRLLAAISAFDSNPFQRAPGLYRLFGRVWSLVPALRLMSQYHRYAF